MKGFNMKTSDNLEQKNVKCPYCNSTDVAEYWYGEFGFDDKLEKILASGKVKLAGCCIFPDSPSHFCKSCGKDFGTFKLD